MFRFPQPQFSRCTECGFVMLANDSDGHICDQERWLDYYLVRLRPHIAAFETEFAAWLLTNQGRFAAFYAERTRLSQ
jgi:hypothetical protein